MYLSKIINSMLKYHKNIPKIYTKGIEFHMSYKFWIREQRLEPKQLN